MLNGHWLKGFVMNMLSSFIPQRILGILLDFEDIEVNMMNKNR